MDREIKNAISSSVLQKNAKLLTTKANRKYHGFGTESIRNLVEKYDGGTEYYEKRRLVCSGYYDAKISIKAPAVKMALFSVIQQNTGTEMVRFLHLGDENLHLGNKTLHSAIKCDMIDLPKNVLKSTVIRASPYRIFCAEKAPNIPITQKTYQLRKSG